MESVPDSPLEFLYWNFLALGHFSIWIRVPCFLAKVFTIVFFQPKKVVFSERTLRLGRSWSMSGFTPRFSPSWWTATQTRRWGKDVNWWRYRWGGWFLWTPPGVGVCFFFVPWLVLLDLFLFFSNFLAFLRQMESPYFSDAWWTPVGLEVSPCP